MDGESSHADLGFQRDRTALLAAGENCWRIEQCHRFGVLVDGENFFAAVRSSLARARRRIIILGWDFDSSTKLRPQRRRASRQLPVGDYLRSLVEHRADLEVYVLIWWGSIFYGANQELPVTFGDTWWSHPRIRFRLDDHHPLGASHHHKIISVDDQIAFVGGMDLTQCRWDDDRHLAENRRRRDGANGDAPYGPVHDVQAIVDGAAAGAIAELARERWRVLTGDELAPVSVRSDPWPARVGPIVRNHPVAIARTQPPVGEQPEAREIEALNMTMLGAAERHIYMEAQYYTIPRLNELLSTLLRKADGPEIVIVANDVPSGWIEQQAMFENRDRLFANLRRADVHSRLRTYTPVTRLHPVCPVKVHSKLIIVDDTLLRIGSSNFNSRSLGVETECDLAIHAQTGQARAAITSVTNMLLAEHIGVSPRRFARAFNRTGSLIRAIETLNIRERRLMAYPVVPVDGEATLVPGTPILDPPQTIDIRYIWRWIFSTSQAR